MYSYVWDETTRGYLLTTGTGRFVANEIRPVFAPELSITDLAKRFEYDRDETRPLLWAQKNTYLLNGEKIAQINNMQYGKVHSTEFFFDGKLKLEPVDVKKMVAKNAGTMDILVADAKRRTKELYDADIKRCDIAYIAFSGGKDSMALLDICHRVLPLSVPVIFSDTDMELPDTYNIWSEIQNRYTEREFICAKPEYSALENWRRFGPPSRAIRWCCSVHKSTPALMLLKDKLHKTAIKAMAFVGVRGDESYSRSFYEDSTDGAKNASQLNCMPILDWGAHELWLYVFANDLLINDAYRMGLPRVGCLLCPESSEKYIWLVNQVYPSSLKPYSEIIIETSAKDLSNTREKNEFIGKRYWQARRSGSVLRDAISAPLEKHNGLAVTFQSPHFLKDSFYEWIKTLGTVFNEKGTERQFLKIPNTLDNGIPFTYRAPCTGDESVTFEFNNDVERIKFLPILKEFLRKVSACIACRSCEAECPFGAISTKNNRIKIDNTKCIKCRKCYYIDKSCWRYRSMYRSEGSTNTLKNITGYRNFGLREGWIDALCEKGDQFFSWDDGHPLGKDMVESAKRWFPQALLVSEKARKPLLLVDLFKKYGTSHPLAWEFIWIALTNNSPLLKWYIISTEVDVTYQSQTLLDLLKEDYPITNNAKDRRLDPLKNTLAESPLGGDNGVAQIEKMGKTVKSITRRSKDVNPLTILYGLYLIAQKSERSSFTVRELLVADETSIFVSPIVAFSIAPDTFKRQCEGLKSKYPDYIETTFTHGNDEVTVFPKKHNTEDIIALALE